MADQKDETRIGFLFDGDPDTDRMVALYEFDDLGVRVKVPFLPHDDDHGRWWSQGIMYGDDPDRSQHSYSPPSELDYFDSKGSVGLIDCSTGRSSVKYGLTSTAGLGIINARYAVEGAAEAAHFVKPNGLRSEMDGLGHWLGYSALSSVIKYKRSDSSYEISTTAKAVEELRLSRSMNLEARAIALGSGHQTPDVTYRSRVFLQTFMKSRRDWAEHLRFHTAFRNLLRVAAWMPINFQSHQVASLSETMTIKEEEKQLWMEVRTATTGIAPRSWTSSDRFLFTFSDIGRVGVGKWLKLADDYSRGVQPLVRLLDLEGAAVDAHLSQLGIAVEAIGYQSLIESGVPDTTANRKSVKQRIDHLVTEVGGAVDLDPNFAQDFADSYNSVKHANRPLVAPAAKVEHYREGVRMLRAWVALKLGLDAATVAARW